MAHFWINRNVPQGPEHQVHADSYVAKDEYFLDEDEPTVMSIRKEITFVIKRSEG